MTPERLDEDHQTSASHQPDQENQVTESPGKTRNRFSKVLYQYLLDDVARKPLKRQGTVTEGTTKAQGQEIELADQSSSTRKSSRHHTRLMSIQVPPSATTPIVRDSTTSTLHRSRSSAVPRKKNAFHLPFTLVSNRPEAEGSFFDDDDEEEEDANAETMMGASSNRTTQQSSTGPVPPSLSLARPSAASSMALPRPSHVSRRGSF